MWHRVLVSGTLAAALVLAGPSWGQEPDRAWDQAAVTSLAGELVDAVNGLRDSMRKDVPARTLGQQSRLRHTLLDRLRLIEAEARAMKRALDGGAGLDETLPIFRRIDLLRRDAAEDAARMFVPEDTTLKITAARGVLEKLRPYYGPAQAPAT